VLVHINRAVQARVDRHARDLLQKSFLRAATSGAGLDTDRTRAAGQTNQINQTSEVRKGRKVSKGAAISTATRAIAVALSTLQI
jgi:hypothetical protein